MSAPPPRDLRHYLKYLRLYAGLLKGYRLAAALIFGMLAVNSVLNTIGLGMLIPLIDNLTGSSNADALANRLIGGIFRALYLPPTVTNILAVFFAIIVLKSTLRYLETLVYGRLRRDLVKDVAERIFANLMHVGYRFYHDTKKGDIIYYISGAASYIGHSLNNMLQLLFKTLLGLAYFVMLALISWRLTVLVAALMLVYVTMFRRRIAVSFNLSRKSAAESQRYNSFIVEAIDGIKIIKSYQTEEHEQRRFAAIWGEYQQLQYRDVKNTARIELGKEPVMVGMLILLVILSLRWMHLTPGLLGAYLVILYYVIPNVQQAITFVNQLANTLPPVEIAIKAMSREGKPYLANGTRPLAAVEKEIRFNGVHFAYRADQPVLRDVSFAIPRNRMTAVVGPTGAGKSTILDLLMRFYDPDAGSITIDGIDLREYDLRDWRRLVSIVIQDNFIFNDTVGNNIRYGSSVATDEDIRRAAAVSRAATYIERMPQGYDTVVGDRGIKLSGGQKQMLALARALIRRPRVLILDEATSSLDNESERLIQDSLDALAGSLTIVIIAHRLSTIYRADNILVLDRHRIVEQGTHAELLAGGSVYQQYHQLQFREEKQTC